MPILIYHGNGLAAISTQVMRIKQGFDALVITELNGKEVPIEQAVVNIGSMGLFSEKRLIVMENYSEKTDLSLLPNDQDTTVLFRFSKALPATSVVLQSAKKIQAQIQEFSEADEVSVFPFLDALGEKNKRAYTLFEPLYQEYGSQYLFTMLYYFYRRLVMHPKKVPSFVLQKLMKQKANFTESQIRKFYQETLETDYKVKMGLLNDRLGLTMIIDMVVEKES